MTAIEEILEEIESMTEGPHWTLSLDSLLGVLGIAREEYYRAQYARRKRYGIQVDEFGPENVARLLEVLEDFGHREAPALFEQAGYYFSPDRLEDWQEFFLSVTTARLLSHEIDREELTTALSACRRPQDGLEYYCEAKFRLEDLVAFACSIYQRKNNIQTHSHSTGALAGHILTLFQKRVLKKEDLFASLMLALAERAVDWGLMKEAELRQKSERLSQEIASALQQLEMPPVQLPDSERLKQQYRALLKKYHPDVNPRGLERTRDINTAYTLLLNRTRTAPSPG